MFDQSSLAKTASSFNPVCSQNSPTVMLHLLFLRDRSLIICLILHIVALLLPVSSIISFVQSNSLVFCVRCMFIVVVLNAV